MATITICDQCHEKVNDRETLIQLDIDVPSRTGVNPPNSIHGEVCSNTCAMKWLATRIQYSGILMAERDFRGNVTFYDHSLALVKALLDAHYKAAVRAEVASR